MDKGADFSRFDPNSLGPVDVTSMLENRHFEQATIAINDALKAYCSGFSSISSPFTSCCFEGYLWISIGELPLSKKLKESLRQLYAVDNGEVQFLNWDGMKTRYPEVSEFKNLRGKAPAFVGFPLPEEDPTP